jgi:hypothetical protein
MRPWLGLWTVALILAPGTARAAGAAPPETLLAKDCVAYLRFDGLADHRQAYALTALAKVLDGDAGVFLDHLVKQVQDALGSGSVREKLLQGLPPDQLVQLSAVARQVPALRTYLVNHGFVLGLELGGLVPPKVQAVLVFPQGATAAHRDTVQAGFRLFGLANRTKVVSTTIEGRAVESLDAGPNAPVQMSWWAEGDHYFCTIGNDRPERTIKRFLDAKQPNLTDNPLFRQVNEFKDYESVLRGYVDFDKPIKIARGVMLFTDPLGPPQNPYLDGLGLGHFQSLTLHLGFRDKYQRSTIQVNLTKDRPGLLKVFEAAGEIQLDRLPALAPDAVGAAAFKISPAGVYDTVVAAAQTVARTKKDKAEVEAALREVDLTLGLDFRKDFLSCFGSDVLLYNSPGEAMFGLGAGLAVRVTDERKAAEGVDTIFKAMLSVADANTRLERRTYRGVETFTVRPESRGFPFAPSAAICNGWLIVGMYPHTVQGFILRSQNPVAHWEPSPLLREELARAQKVSGNKVLAATESDPRMTLKALASFSPFFLAISEQFGGDFDPTLIPNFQSVTEHLFPNVTVAVDTGTSIRLDTTGSIGIPFDIIGLETYWFGVFVLGSM